MPDDESCPAFLSSPQMNLRPYQSTSKSLLRQSFQNGNKRILLALPTGSGKTVIFTDIANDVAKNNKTVLICVNRKELIKQTLKKCQTYGLNPTIIAPGHKQIKSNIYIASVDTLIRREFPDIDLLIVDEAHIETFDKILKAYPNTLTIGCTATPIRASKKNPIRHYYQDIIQPVSIQELIKNNYLVNAISFGAKKDLSGIKTKFGDYDEKSLFAAFDKTELYGGVVEHYKRIAPNSKAMCFNINVEHSKKQCHEFAQAGISTRHIDGTTPSLERESILNQFASGEFAVLNNVAVLTTGYDEPSIETIILNRATKSLALFLQMCGRGSRPSFNKDHFKIIDMGSNVYRHGFWEDYREFDLLPEQPKSGDAAAPVKLCPKCEAIMHTSVMICSVCGHVFEKEINPLKSAEFGQIEKPDIPAHLQMKWSDMNVPQLVELAKLKGYKPGWVLNQIKKRTEWKIMLQEMASLYNYKDGWVRFQARLINDAELEKMTTIL